MVVKAGGGSTAMRTIHADEMKPGDTVVWGGCPHTITNVERRDGWAWPIASDGSGWAVALDDHLVHIERKAA
jgi:hypothetical protein